MPGIRTYRMRRQSVRRPRLPMRVEELEPRALLAAATLTGALQSGIGGVQPSDLTAVLGQAFSRQLAIALPTITAPFAVLASAVNVVPEPISFSQLALPGSQASPMAQLPPVPFPYITGPALPAPGPVHAMPTFAVDIARVNDGVGGATPERNTVPGIQRAGPTTEPDPLQPSPAPSLLVPPILLEPGKENQDPETKQVPGDKTSGAESAEGPTWAEISAAYFAAEAAPN